MKNVNNFRSINCTLMKIEILAVSDPLSNFQLIMEVDLLLPKYSKYALKLIKQKNKILRMYSKILLKKSYKKAHL